MNEAIISQWNSQVAVDDKVFFLGDFSISKSKVFDSYLVNKLNGTKYLILGNHDAGFKTFHKDQNQLAKQRNKYLDAGWKDVFTDTILTLKDGSSVYMTHLPPCIEEDNRFLEYRAVNNPNSFYLHGHLHGHYRKKRNMIDVCFDADLKLLSEDDILELKNSGEYFIPTRLTNKYSSDVSLTLMPFENEVKSKNVRRVVSDDLDLVLYNYTDQCTFERAWNEITRISRGIIFEKSTGKLVACAMSKFFNLGEMSETSLSNLPDEPYVVTEKMDGSLGIIYNYKNEWRVATRGAFSSEQAVKGLEILKKYDMSSIPKTTTLMAEIIYPDNKIVANYGNREELVLLAANNLVTEQECSRDELLTISKTSGMPLVKEYNYTIGEMVALQKTLPKDKEGFVVRFQSGLRVKIKGAEYCRIHRMISQMSPLSFYESMENGKVKIDYLTQLPEEFRKEADELTRQLEDLYQDTFQVLLLRASEVIDRVKCDNPEVSVGSEEFKKILGLKAKQINGLCAAAIWPVLYRKFDNLDKLVMKTIRPKSNVIGATNGI